MHLLHQMPWVSCHNGRTACSVGLSLLQAVKWYMHNECTQSSENKIGCAHRRFLLQNRLLLFFQQNLPLRSALFWKFSLLDCHLYVASVLLSHWPGTCIWHPDVFFFFYLCSDSGWVTQTQGIHRMKGASEDLIWKQLGCWRTHHHRYSSN